MLTSCFLYVGGGGQNAIWFTVFDAMFPIAYCAKAHTSDDGGSWRNEAPPHGKGTIVSISEATLTKSGYHAHLDKESRLPNASPGAIQFCTSQSLLRLTCVRGLTYHAEIPIGLVVDRSPS